MECPVRGVVLVIELQGVASMRKHIFQHSQLMSENYLKQKQRNSEFYTFTRNNIFFFFLRKYKGLTCKHLKKNQNPAMNSIF